LRPDGVYDFNWELLSESHKWNQNRVEECIKQSNLSRFFDTIIIVDNTNITFKEMEPYIRMALENGFEVEFKEPDNPDRYDVEKSFERNTHGVPYATILKMSQRWENHETITRKLKELENSFKG